MNAKSLLLVGTCLVSAPVWADTVTLNNGTQVEGVVLAFKNQKFDFESDKGAKTVYEPSVLRRIDFKIDGEANGVGAEIVHRTRGPIRARVSEFSGGNFKVVDPEGNEQSMPALLITSAAFAGGKT